MKIMQFMASTSYGGAEMVFVELSNILAKEYEVTALLLRNTEYAYRFSDNVKVVFLASHPTINNPLLHYELFKTLQNIGPDIIHTHAVKGAVLVSRVNTLLKLPHLATKHNDRKGKIFNKLPWVSCVSQKGKESVHSTTNKVKVIYNGLTPVSIEKAGKTETFSMISIGRLDAIKGFAELINQVSRLNFDFMLTIVGEGPEKENLLRLIKERNLEKKVHLAGYCENVAQRIHQSHLVVIASHKEGGPKTAIETLFYGHCLLSTAVGLVPEFFPAKLQTGHQKMAEKITEIYQNYSLFTEEFANLKRILQSRFLLSEVAVEYENYYRQIIAAQQETNHGTRRSR